MLDDAAEVLLRAREKARYVLENDQGNVERITEADESGGFVGSINVKTARQVVRLVSDYPNHVSI